ncbi:MAG: type II toxin-antitoxin system VapC family toxin, partial [Gammaproteobacteria bacterium]|nr:type II toxin-antitoxin system VapC family toxin [Gammaproteobacteria bacterium]
MNYLLDSNTVSDFYNSAAPCHDAIANKFGLLTDNDKVYVSVLCLYELGYGLANAPEDKKALVRKQLRQAPQDFELLPVLAEGAVLFGELKKSLQTQRSLNAKQMRRHNVDCLAPTLLRGSVYRYEFPRWSVGTSKLVNNAPTRLATLPRSHAPAWEC